MIGPTPQRDGIVLGLFDLLPAETPSKRRSVLSDVAPNILKTPSKNTSKTDGEQSLESKARGEKTPVSVGKRFLLDRFVTPKKRKLDEQGTPTSAFKGLSTPAFLRRDNTLHVIDEDDEATPRPAPWKRRGLGRSLSSMIQSMKKQEDDRLDEEAEIMREMEMEAQGIPVPTKTRIPSILVEDSQAPMPLGPDRGLESDDDEDENEAADNLGPDGKPRRIWKKRGQKRTTRRVIMRPNFTKPKPEAAPPALDEDSEVEARVTETQQNTDQTRSDDKLSEDEASEYASDDSHTPKKRKHQPKKAAALSTSQAEDKTKEGPVKKAARKVKATANANYRRLKIKGKGGNGGKGKFGRRR